MAKKKNRGKGLAGLLNPTRVHRGNDLLRLARGLARLQVRPQVNAYQRLARELRGQEVADTLALERLGRETEQNVASAYRGFDRGSANDQLRAAGLGQMLSNQQEQLGRQANQQMRSYQTGNLGGYQEAMALRGSPGGGQAQQALANLVQAQAGRRAADTQAQGSFAASQGAAYAGLAGGMRQAGQLQGASAQRDLNQMIASRVAEQRLQAGQDIREARGQAATARSLRGEQTLNVLNTLMGGERDLYLGQLAADTSRMTAEIAAGRLAEDARQFDISHTRTGRPRRTQGSGGGGGGGGNGGGGNGGGHGDRSQDEHQINAAIQNFPRHVPQNNAQISGMISWVQNETGAPYAQVSRLVRQWINRHG